MYEMAANNSEYQSETKQVTTPFFLASLDVCTTTIQRHCQINLPISTTRLLPCEMISEPLPYDNNTIRAMRINYRYKVVDDIDIFFSEKTNRSCSALAESSSQNWYSLFDDGRNYCNLRDLVAGAGYDNHYLEFTGDMVCTQYEMAHCQ